MNTNWTRWLPRSIRKRLDEQPTILKVLKNAAWLSADKVITAVIGILVGVWVARYLGPEQFGTYSYAVAFVAIFMPLTQLGLRDIIIRNIVRTPSNKNEILGTNLVLQLLSGLFFIAFTILLASAMNAGDSLTISLIVIISLGMLFQPFSNTSGDWFLSQDQARYSVWSKNIVFILIALLKLGLILAGASLSAFAWSMTLTAILISVALMLTYHLTGESFVEWRFKFVRAQELLRDSWPLIFSGIAIVIYMRIDQIMLGQMTSKTELGYYSVAVRLSELWYFLSLGLAIAVFPSIVRSRQHKDAAVYYKRLQIFYDMMVGTSYLVVIPLLLLATPLVVLLYGIDFAPAGPILMVHALAFVFISISVARGNWLVTENLVRFSLLAMVLGLIVNIVLNYLLIPKYTGLGAAWATAIAYCVSGYLSSLLSAKTRMAFKQSSLALLIPFRLIFGKANLSELA